MSNLDFNPAFGRSVRTPKKNPNGTITEELLTLTMFDAENERRDRMEERRQQRAEARAAARALKEGETEK